jgi:4-hydroxy-tetrahydrodipicolinate reductase
MIRVCVAGATGWVGRALLPAIADAADLELTGAVARSFAGRRVAELLPNSARASNAAMVVVRASVEDALAADADVLVDYTSPELVKANVFAAIRRRAHVVIGTSGLTASDFAEIDSAAREHGVGVIAGANFAVSAILLESFATIAARYLPSWEILDFASAAKPDAPSGTARRLASRLASVRAPAMTVSVEQTHGEPAARGLDFEGTQVHSIRLPGHVIGAEVMFGSADERLSIRYEGGSGASPYVKGTLAAVRRVTTLTGLSHDLEQVLRFAQ